MKTKIPIDFRHALPKDTAHEAERSATERVRTHVCATLTRCLRS